MTAVSETNLATKCLDFCQILSSQGLAFKFSLTVGSNFSFTLDTKVLASDTQAKKKKSSPSTISPTASSERQMIAVRRDGTMPSFSQLDGNVNHSPPPTAPPPGTTSSASTFNPLAGPHCPTGTVEKNADYGDSPPSDAPPPPSCVSRCGPTEWGWTRRQQNNTKHGYRCLALCLGEDSCITTTIFA